VQACCEVKSVAWFVFVAPLTNHANDFSQWFDDGFGIVALVGDLKG